MLRRPVAEKLPPILVVRIDRNDPRHRSKGVIVNSNLSVSIGDGGAEVQVRTFELVVDPTLPPHYRGWVEPLTSDIPTVLSGIHGVASRCERRGSLYGRGVDRRILASV